MTDFTPLMLSAINNFSICRLIYIYGADITAKNNEGKTALDLAIEYNNELNTKFLKNPYRCPFILAYIGNNDDEVIELIKKDTSLINKRDIDNWNIINNAISSNSIKIIEFLIDNNVNIYDKTKISVGNTSYYLTPLLHSIVKRYNESAKFLISKI